jgi:hypothetical protein
MVGARKEGKIGNEISKNHIKAFSLTTMNTLEMKERR